MTREVKKPEVRKNEILDAARKFFFQKGYDQTTIQDIIDELSIAKGTFYYYFTSKIDLLDQLVDRTTSEISASIKPILNMDMNAIEKFNKVFQVATAVSLQNIDVFLVPLGVMYKDENTIIRVKMYRRMVEKSTPLLSSIIEQGIKEGVFNNPYHSDAAELLMQIVANLDETICRLILHEDKTLEQLAKIMVQKTKLYLDAMERILGAPKDSLRVYILDDYEEMAKMFYKKLRDKEDV
ncbi:MAG: TetR/AcrR family transcriptional regulator [Candidatus Stahlbacteria bacterium]|nr:MAG: TetR/AcrR family transcriptional regulator [Candidatus Stahlbacteria bacterium]